VEQFKVQLWPIKHLTSSGQIGSNPTDLKAYPRANPNPGPRPEWSSLSATHKTLNSGQIGPNPTDLKAYPRANPNPGPRPEWSSLSATHKTLNSGQIGSNPTELKVYPRANPPFWVPPF